MRQLPAHFAPARIFRFSALALSILSGCFFNDSLDSGSEDIQYAGMKKIPASGKSFIQGSPDSLAPGDERPPFQVTFTYDFWMDTSEVTQGGFFEITGRSPVSDTCPYGTGPDFPVYYVTWYDAVLYCNALSRQMELDTVYVYSGIETSPDGSAIGLDGLTARFDLTGVRLPTEAEWEYAGGAGISQAFSWGGLSDSARASGFAWYTSNAEGRAHPAGRLKPNRFGLYDMAGNVMEWCGDWKGPYFAEDIANSLGNRHPNATLERILKGGSFNYGLMALRTSSRKATYPAIAASKNEYAGFRCVIGALKNSRYFSDSDISIQTNPVHLVSGREEIKNLFYSDRVKICFANVSGGMHHLCYIDFSAPEIRVNEIPDTFSVFHPAISPDGEYAAFCTRAEGMNTASSIYIRRLDPSGSGLTRLEVEKGYIPRWMVSPATPDTFLYFTNSAMDNGDSAAWLQTSTFRIRISGGQPDGDVETLLENGSFHDGPSLYSDYLVTGFSRLLTYSYYTRAITQLFLPPANGKDPEGSRQVCNVSISQHADRPLLAFLDFGYPRTSSIIHQPYGIHEYLFISDINGTIQQTIRRPGGEDAWEHPEWANRGDWIVSGATSITGAHASIYLINSKNQSVSKVLEGTELWHPNLWLANNPAFYMQALRSGISLDSMGQYMKPHLLVNQIYMTLKMRYFWERAAGLEAVFLGNSRMANGLNPGFISGYRSLNMSDGGMGLKGIREITQSYLLNHCAGLKLIGMSLYLSSFAAKNGDVTWSRGMEQSFGFQYDKGRNFWKDSIPENFLAYMKNAQHVFVNAIDTLGYTYDTTSTGWGGMPPAIMETSFRPDTSLVFQENLQALRSFCGTLSDRGVHLLVINFPQSPAYRDTPWYGRHGLLWEDARAAIDSIRAVLDQYPLCHFYDAYNFGVHDYTDSDAFDYDHLGPSGAEKLSIRVDSLIHQILE